MADLQDSGRCAGLGVADVLDSVLRDCRFSGATVIRRVRFESARRIQRAFR